MLSIKNLSHTYPNGVEALNNISIDIPKGMFGLLGPNGAGKSSFMRVLATLLQPSSGEVQFDGIDVIEQPDLLRRRLGYLPQDFGVYPRGSALEILDHIAVLKGIVDGKQRKYLVEKLLHQTNLYVVRKKRLATFSGGMQRRFGIAQALLGQPKLLIVDEPTAGLDPEERNRFHNLLSEIGEEVVVILSTHIVEDVAVLCPNMAILVGGKIVSQGKPSDLVDNLNQQIWTKTIAKGELDSYRQSYRVISNNLVVGQTVIRIQSDRDPGNGFQAIKPTLEDVYFCQINPPVSVPDKAIRQAA